MEMLAAAAVAGAGGVFSYNRQSFFFDKELEVKRSYQGQRMRIKQFELYREDVRDLVSLTVGKMDNYLIVNTLQLGFTFTLFAEGRPEPGKFPNWLACLFCMCNAGAFLYYLLSIWLAMHASVSAHAFGVRMLTQCVRLPLPGIEQLNAAVRFSQDYEGGRVQNILRIPLWKQQMRRLNAAMANATTEDAATELATGASDAGDGGSSDQGSETTQGPLGPDRGMSAPITSPVASLEHVQLFRQLQANWQSYDAYARVCMAMGTNQLLQAFSYITLGKLFFENKDEFPAICCFLLFTSCAWSLARLDLYLSRNILLLAAFLNVAPPSLTIMTVSWFPHIPSLERCSVTTIFMLHILWIIFTVFLSRAGNFGQVALPTVYRSVVFLDVFGWLAEHEQEQEADQEQVGAPEGVDNTGTDDTNLPLSPVQEETFSQSPSSAQQNASGDSVPPHLCALLLTDCRKLRAALRHDFALWERDEVSNLLRDDPLDMRVLARLHDRFNSASVGLDQEWAVTVGSSASAASAAFVPEDEAREEPAWLRLTWNGGYGDTMDYFYHSETSETIWEPPLDGVRISTLQSLGERLNEFCEQMTLAKASVAPTPAPHRTSSLSVTAQGSSWRWPSSSASSRRRSNASRSPWQIEVCEEEVATGAAGNASSAEQSQQDSFFQHSVLAGGTFHPTPSSDPTTSRRQRRRRHDERTPGRLPWQVVLRGSIMLVVAWIAAFLTVVATKLFLFEFHFEHNLPKKEMTLLPLQLEEVAVSGGWPHPFFRPNGLACSASTGLTAIVSEKYMLHEVRLAAQQPTAVVKAVPPVVASCLAALPGLMRDGLADISLFCPVSPPVMKTATWHGCYVLLLRGDGHKAVRCSLNATTSTALNISQISLLGGPWVAAAGESETALWALRGTQPIVAHLWPRLGAATELLPHLDVDLDRRLQLSSSPVQLHAIPGNNQILLSLHAEGQLHAWHMAGGLLHSWALKQTKAQEVRWGGFCVAPQRLLLVGTEVRPGTEKAMLWQVELPPELHVVM